MSADPNSFGILVSPLWRPLLAPLGVNEQRASISFEDDSLRVRFGWVFQQSFPLRQVEGVELAQWPLWAGIGPRCFRDIVGLIGTYVNVVQIRFKEPQHTSRLPFGGCRRLFVTVETPRAFIESMNARLTPAEATPATT